jgi:hypothetical protein
MSGLEVFWLAFKMWAGLWGLFCIYNFVDEWENEGAFTMSMLLSSALIWCVPTGILYWIWIWIDFLAKKG